MTTADPFELTADQEAALWRLAEALGVSPTANVLTLVKEVACGGRGLPGHEAGHRAACELVAARAQGRAVQLHQRPGAREEVRRC